MATQQTIDDIRQLGSRLRGILALADELEGVNSLEQSTAEARARLDAVGKQIQDAEAKLAAVNSEVADAKAQAEQIGAQATKQADKLVADAQEEADRIRGQADEDARSRIDAGQRELDAVAKQRDELKTEVESLAAKRDATSADIAKAVYSSQAELTALESKIAAAKDQVRKILG